MDFYEANLKCNGNGKFAWSGQTEIDQAFFWLDLIVVHLEQSSFITRIETFSAFPFGFTHPKFRFPIPFYLSFEPPFGTSPEW